MPRKKAAPYRHKEKAKMRPEGGTPSEFAKNRRDDTPYRYDSSVAPELHWDESAIAAEADQLLQEIRNADSLDKAKAAAAQLQSMHKPFLNWAGKAEKNEFQVPCLPLFVHERLSTQAILDTLERHKRDRTGTLDLFNEGDQSIGEKIAGAYKHFNGWQNRLIHGDSLQVMNSLLQYESMGEQVQMVYMDPPYGIRYGSNFQPYVRKPKVKDGDDKSITREPEMVQAYRDTWKLGTHSWLTYMRDRLLLAHQLLADKGSCFVQINDEHAHYVRNIMDEVFGKENFFATIGYRTKTPLGSKHLGKSFDFIIWYAKDINKVKYQDVFREKTTMTDRGFSLLEMPNGKVRRLTKDEVLDNSLIPAESKIFTAQDLTSSGTTETCVFPFTYDGKTFVPGGKKSWRTNEEGMKKLARDGRLYRTDNTLYYRYYLSDFPMAGLTDIWTDTQNSETKSYVVQTAREAIQRCMLMATDPGDLVFDPTCGSGTTAYVAEQWGRRWITTDVSRVPLSLARQRLLTATYDYYKLKGETPSQGFIYSRKNGGIANHVTLKSVVHDEPVKEEILVDKPDEDPSQTRITGPFCVEAVMPLPLSLAANDDAAEETAEPQADYLSRMIDTLRLSPNIRYPGNKSIELKEVHPLAKSLNLHAEATLSTDEKVAIIIGPATAAIGEASITEAAKEAKGRGYAGLFVVAFAIDPKTRAMVEKLEQLMDIRGTYVQANTDITMGDMLKNLRTSEVFAVCGQPDVVLEKIRGGGGGGKPI